MTFDQAVTRVEHLKTTLGIWPGIRSDTAGRCWLTYDPGTWVTTR